MNPIVIEQPFAIQAGEVTVGEFRSYADSLDEARRAQLGTWWEQDQDGTPYSDDRPVENISWQEAVAYAEWLSKKTGQNFRLPTVQQWAAACVKYGREERPVLNRADNQPISTLRGKEIDHLLGNLREWSSDFCRKETDKKGRTYSRYRLLGENYMTDPTDSEVIGTGHCAREDEQWAGVGFRLVRIGN